ncbi:hypothetical protein OAA15_00250 [bacterium]|nr:hypothetical protein [bacterium]
MATGSNNNNNRRSRYEEARDLRQTLSAITDEFGRQQSLQSEIRKSFSGLRDIAKEIQYTEGEIRDISDKQLQTLKDRAAKNLEDLKTAASRINLGQQLTVEETALLAAKREGFQIEQAALDALDEQIERRKELNAAVGWYETMAKGISKIPFGNLVAGPFKAGADNAKKMALATQKAAQESGGVASKQQLARSAFKGFAGSVAKSAMKGGAFGLLAFAVNTIVEAFMNADKQSVELSRSLGVNARQSELLRDNIADIANIGLTTAAKNSENVQKAFLKTSSIMGVSLDAATQLSSNERNRLSILTDINERLGLSDGAFKNLVDLSRINNKNANETLSTITSTVFQVGLQNKTLFNTKEILEEVLNVSDSIALQFKFNVREIARATAEAKLLGFSLGDIEGIQSNLLNFQSSIQSEMEAELLTGRELNLERARGLALQGDLLGVGKEIATQVGGLGGFQRLNIIQQEALAKSVGLSREALTGNLKEADKLRKLQSTYNSEQFKSLVAEQLGRSELDRVTDKHIQTLIRTGSLTDELMEQIGAEQVESLKREDASKRFQRAIESVKDVITRLVSGGVLDTIAGAFETFALAIQGGASFTDILMGNAGDIALKQERANIRANDDLTASEKEELIGIVNESSKIASKIQGIDEYMDAYNVPVNSNAWNQKMDEQNKLLAKQNELIEKQQSIELKIDDRVLATAATNRASS